MPDEDTTVTRSTFVRIAPILVFVALVVGAGLRLSGLVDHTIDHNEIYVPGVRLPADMSIPDSRLTLYRTIRSTIVTECHPPGYYLLMLPWTMCFGYNPLAIRLPSAIIDVATILLIYLLGARLGLRKEGVLASFLWATAGLPIYLAQEARMYPLACFLGVLATVLLVESYWGDRSRQRLVIGAYVLAILGGLSTSHFFWLILIAHMLYVQFGPAPPGRRAAPQAQWQLFALALASPLLAVAAFQSGRPSYLSPDVWLSVQAYFRLLYVWYSDETLKVAPWLGGVASLGCVLLLIVGVLRTRRQSRAASQSTIGCPRWLLYVASVLAFMSIEAFAWITHHREFPWLARRTGAIVACGAIPFLVLIVDSVTRRGLLAGWLESCVGAPLGPIWLVTFLAVVPVGLLALVSMAIPLIADRTVSIFAPYLMLVVSVGAIRLCQARLARGLAVVLLLSLNTAGFLEYHKQPHSPTDYSALAAQVASKAQPGDIWFIFVHWATTPIFYYLDPDQYAFVARDHAQILSKRPNSRVWVLGFEGLPPPTRVTAPLSGYRQLVRVEARGIYADLYIPVSDDSIEKTDAGDSDIGLH
jgi:4-amino-4-deoxy-L-arabinose transferase-like glycosyltransferase